jgi:hypothetical protein
MKATGTPPPRCVDKDGAAAYLGVSVNTIVRLINAGVLPIVRLPVQRTESGLDPDGASRRVLIDVRDLDDLIDRNKENRGGAMPQIVPRQARK